MKRTKHLTRRARIFSPMSRFSEHLAGGTGGNSKKQRTVDISIVIYITIYIYIIYTHTITHVFLFFEINRLWVRRWNMLWNMLNAVSSNSRRSSRSTELGATECGHAKCKADWAKQPDLAHFSNLFENYFILNKFTLVNWAFVLRPPGPFGARWPTYFV